MEEAIHGIEKLEDCKIERLPSKGFESLGGLGKFVRCCGITSVCHIEQLARRSGKSKYDFIHYNRPSTPVILSGVERSG